MRRARVWGWFGWFSEFKGRAGGGDYRVEMEDSERSEFRRGGLLSQDPHRLS